MKKLLLSLVFLTASAFGQFAPSFGNITAQGSACTTAGACVSLHMVSPAVQSVGVQLTGTFSATLQFEGSQDNGANWFAVAISPMPNGATVSSATATGNWALSTAGLTDVRVRCSTYSSGTVVANLQPTLAPLVLPDLNSITSDTFSAAMADPCENPNVAKSSAVIAFSSATTSALVALSSGKVIYVCAFTISMTSGTTPTLLFKTGTQTTNPCDTGTVNLTGTMALPTSSGTFITVGAGHSMFQTPASFQLCITTAGTSPTGNGWITYVQK